MGCRIVASGDSSVRGLGAAASGSRLDALPGFEPERFEHVSVEYAILVCATAGSISDADVRPREGAQIGSVPTVMTLFCAVATPPM